EDVRQSKIIKLENEKQETINDRILQEDKKLSEERKESCKNFSFEEKQKLFDEKRQELLILETKAKIYDKSGYPISIVDDFIKNERNETEFITKDNPYWGRKEGILGLSSLLEALADNNPDNQPLGVDVVELASKYNIPSIMFTAEGHVKGSYAYVLVNEYLTGRGLFNGIDFGENANLIHATKRYSGLTIRNGHNHTIQERYEKLKNFFINATLQKENESFEEIKDSEEMCDEYGLFEDDSCKEVSILWQNALENIKNRVGEKDRYKILFVEDSPLNADFAQCAFTKDISSKRVEIINVPDYESAEKVLNEKNSEIDGVITDLYFRDKLGSTEDKKHGENIYRKLVVPFLKNPNKVDELLEKVKQAYVNP
ncbi:MAG: hypothetical protein ACYC40_04700, partial [Patescibacteria group bacterium]